MTDFLLRHGWPLLASVAVKSLFVLALAGLVVLALRRASAAARHLVWSLALLGLLLLPLFSSALPAFWQVPLGSRNLLVTPDAPTLTPSSPIPNFTGDGRSLAPNSGGVGGKAGSVEGRPGGSPLHLTPPELGAGGRSLPWPVWACGIWLIGAVLTLLPSLIGLAGVRRLTRRSSSVPVGPLPELTTELAKKLGVRAPVRLLLGEAGTPMTWGWLRPVILLPRGADQWPPDRLRAVLLHELAHIARADWPAQMASHLACAFYWFNPLVWLAAGQARVEGERACDDRVLLAGIPAPDYARHLLDVARSLRDTPLPTVLPMANSSRVEDRLRAILQPKRRRTMVTRKALTVALLAATAVVAFLAALRPAVPAQAEGWPPAAAMRAPASAQQSMDWARMPGHAKNTVAQMRRLYRYMSVYRQRHGSFPTEPADGIGLLMGDMASSPRNYGLPAGGFDQNLRRAAHALANPDARLMGYGGNPDRVGVYLTQHPLVNGPTLSGRRDVLAWTSLYVHPGRAPKGVYLVLWADGQVEAVPAAQVLFAPVDGLSMPLSATALVEAMRTGTLDWVPCFPGQHGIPAQAVSAEKYWLVQIAHERV